MDRPQLPPRSGSFGLSAARWLRAVLGISRRRPREDDALPDLRGINFDRRNGPDKAATFLWGASTSSHQVEGGVTTSDWHAFTSSPTIKRRVERVGSAAGMTLRLEPPGRAVDHWDMDVLAADLDRACLLGL